MKIAFVYDTIYPYVKGGVEKRIWLLARMLAREHEVHVFGMKYWKGRNEIKREGVFLHGVCTARELYGKNGKRRILPAVIYSVKLFFALMKHDFDLIEVQNFPVLPFFPVKIYSVIKRKPFVLVWCEVWGDYWKEYLGSIKGGIGKALEKLMASASPYNIVLTSGAKKTISFLQKNPKKNFVVPVPIEFAEIDLIGVSSKKSDLVFVGRLIEEKNLEALLKALVWSKKEFKEKKFFIIGNGPEKEKLLALKKSLGLSFVEFLSEVNGKEMFSLFKASKLFLFPSKREGFGLSTIEANACGLPVITLDAKMNASVELVKNGENGFICKNEKEMAKKSLELLENTVLLKKMKQSSVKSAKRFDSKIVLEELKKVYSIALKGERI